MRGDVVARISRFAWSRRLNQLVQLANLGLQQIDLLLLAKDRAIQLVKMVFFETELDFEFGDSGFHADSPVIQWQRQRVLRGHPLLIATSTT